MKDEISAEQRKFILHIRIIMEYISYIINSNFSFCFRLTFDTLEFETLFELLLPEPFPFDSRPFSAASIEN